MHAQGQGNNARTFEMRKDDPAHFFPLAKKKFASWSSSGAPFYFNVSTKRAYDSWAKKGKNKHKNIQKGFRCLKQENQIRGKNSLMMDGTLLFG
jgi:hypothetical protein